MRGRPFTDKRPNKIVHIGFLEIKYSSPPRLREFDLFSFTGYLFDIQFRTVSVSDLLNTQDGILSLRLHIPAVSCGWVLAKKPALQNRAGRTKNLKFGCYGAEAFLSKNSGLFVSLCSSAVQPQPGSATSTEAASGHRHCTGLCILIPCPALAAVWGWWSHIFSLS